MTYPSDDQTSSKTPFSGDQTGDIFSEPSNLVAQSPVTTVRTVETQSGFLVVLKDVEERISLSVKRKIGTPPQSHVLLTPDEVRRLSRILAGQNQEETSEFKVTGLQPESAVGSDSQPASGSEGAPGAVAGSSDRAIDTLTFHTQKSTDFSDLEKKYKKQRGGNDGLISPRRSSEKKVLIFGGVSIATLVILAVVAAGFLFFNYSSSTPPQEAKEIAKRGMNSENVDTFVRTYVSNLLDFSPRSYKYSQIQAMSKMNPELLKKYWRETNFPLSKRQLKRLPKDQTVVVNKVLQAPTSSVTTDVDLYAELLTSKSKQPTPVHLKLGLSLNQDGNLEVVSQKDLTAEDAKNSKKDKK